MAMGTRRRRQRQEPLWISHNELAKGPAHPFYQRVNELLEAERFDEFAEQECAKFYAENTGRPSLPPGIYFRLLLVGYFEGLDGERGIAWRAADSLGLRKFLGIAIDEDTPEHSTISRTRRLIDVETHRKVFFWILELLRDRGLLKGKIVGVSAKRVPRFLYQFSILFQLDDQAIKPPSPFWRLFIYHELKVGELLECSESIADFIENSDQAPPEIQLPPHHVVTVQFLNFRCVYPGHF